MNDFILIRTQRKTDPPFVPFSEHGERVVNNRIAITDLREVHIVQNETNPQFILNECVMGWFSKIVCENKKRITMMKHIEKPIIAFVMVLCIAACAYAGNLEPPAGDPGSTMHSLEDIYNLVNTGIPQSQAAVRKTGAEGLTGYTFVAGEDGILKKGVPSPSPRFKDNGNGTVTDNLTGLIWLRNASAAGSSTWENALTYCHNLAAGTAGLSDGSAAGDWRLPNRSELESLINLAYHDPCISNAAGNAKWSNYDPFINVLSDYYWTSTTCAKNTDGAWLTYFLTGYIQWSNKTAMSYVWPVRGGKD